MTPAEFGYRPCARCGTMRPESALGFGAENGSPALSVVCRDTAFCTRAAGVGLGKLDVKETP